MRRENRRHEDKENQDSFKNLVYFFSGVLGLAILTFVLTFTMYSNKLKREQNNSELNSAKVTDLVPSISTVGTNDSLDVSTQIGKTIEEAEKEIDKNQEETAGNATQTQNTAQVQNVTKQEPKAETKKPEIKRELIFEKPVDGKIIFEFAMEKLIYSETLKEWITHPGVDIKADKTTIVKASEDGTVKAIKNDPRYGLTVILEHEDGFTTVYSNLLTAEFVKVGEELKKGQTLGTVGNTATFESVSESHLHFEILKDNIQVDPIIYVVF